MKRNAPFLNELGDLIGKHKLTIDELMDNMADFFAFTAVKMGDEEEFMKRLTDNLMKWLNYYWNKGPKK